MKERMHNMVLLQYGFKNMFQLINFNKLTVNHCPLNKPVMIVSSIFPACNLVKCWRGYLLLNLKMLYEVESNNFYPVTQQ